MSDRPTRLPRLDALRGLAVALVLFGHTAYYGLESAPFGELAGVGVLLFFVLSGYLITTLLVAERERDGGIALGRFYVRRAVRLLPALWTLVAAVGIATLAGVVTDVSPGGFVASLLFIRNLGGRGQTLSHLWTLSLEMQFYAIWPIVVARCGVRRARVVAVAAIAACVLWRGWAVATQRYPWETDVFYLRTDFRIDSILVGCLVALGVPARRPDAPWAVQIRNPWPWLVALLAWALLASRSVALRPIFLTGETLLAVMFFVAVAVAWPTAERGDTMVGGALLGRLGRVSYSVYLWQQPFVVDRFVHTGRPLVDVGVALLLFVVASTLSYVCIERPTMRLRPRWLGAPAPADP